MLWQLTHILNMCSKCKKKYIYLFEQIILNKIIYYFSNFLVLMSRLKNIAFNDNKHKNHYYRHLLRNGRDCSDRGWRSTLVLLFYIRLVTGTTAYCYRIKPRSFGARIPLSLFYCLYILLAAICLHALLFHNRNKKKFLSIFVVPSIVQSCC